MARIIPELSYDSNLDECVLTDAHVRLAADLSIAVSAGTAAGRREPDGPTKPNEDAWSIVQHDDGTLVAAIFDGASSQQPIPELENVSGARYASHTLKDMLEDRVSERPRTTLLALNRLLGLEFEQFASVDFSDVNTLPTSTIILARINPAEDLLEIVDAGDGCGAVLLENDETRLLTKDRHRVFDEQVLNLIVEIAREQGLTPREARSDPRVKKAIREMFQDTRNRPDGTGEGILNGDPNVDGYVHNEILPLSSVKAILLTSDGLVPPNMDERKPADLRRLFDIAGRCGIAGLVNFTRRIEDADPHRWFERYKHSDDATGLFFELQR